MNSYADKLNEADRWAVVAYIRALQVSQNPDIITRMNSNPNTNQATPPAGITNNHGGAR
jgi:mono/diheme cytochrome c family protein